MKKLFYFFFLFIISCSINNIKNDRCLSVDGFNFQINSKNLTKIDKKKLLDSLINESNIIHNENSSIKLILNIFTRESSSLVSLNNTTVSKNITFITEYKIIDNNDILLDEGHIILIDDLDVVDNRFANYVSKNYITDNFIRNLTYKLENKVSIFLKNNEKNCLLINNKQI